MARATGIVRLPAPHGPKAAVPLQVVPGVRPPECAAHGVLGGVHWGGNSMGGVHDVTAVVVTGIHRS